MAKTSINRNDVAVRAILRLILSSRKRTPTEILYAGLSGEPTVSRRNWLSLKYLVKHGHQPANSVYRPIYPMFHSDSSWPPRCIPTMWPAVVKSRQSGVRIIVSEPGCLLPASRFIHPWEDPHCRIMWFPVNSNEFPTSQQPSSCSQDWLHRFRDRH